VRKVRHLLDAYRLTALGVPVLTSAAAIRTGRVGYTILTFLISSAALLWFDWAVRTAAHGDDDDEP